METPKSSTIDLALALIAAMADPKTAEKRIKELAEHSVKIEDANRLHFEAEQKLNEAHKIASDGKAQAEAAARANDQFARREMDLKERERSLADRAKEADELKVRLASQEDRLNKERSQHEADRSKWTRTLAAKQEELDKLSGELKAKYDQLQAIIK